MRLFIAVNFNEAVVDSLAGIQEELKECGMVGNFTRPENLHLTLAFIGEYGNPQDILDAMESVPFEPFSLKVTGLRHDRDLYFARTEEQPALLSYVRRLRRALAEQGIPFDRKKFSPHITLIRKVSFRSGESRIPDVTPDVEIEVGRISLMRSERGKRGMIYTEIGYVLKREKDYM